ncbi:hypothetical protein TH63_03815 [Rufibacter radiotolerans]|uniref:DUF2927 domain-containing protein n=1 Tax=Rufibacter radiotolerans TaxID=1379910 RepID=A0A0H4VHX2_9BACT|nr:DUF2927 domain-containing protein [Rufibacter radiotolerans]AKQ44953.1 hypothetical protein TH63_03815 [Rufibacter radiotolerans]
MKKTFILFAFLSFLFTGCLTEEEEVTPELTQYDQSVISYFKEIGLGFFFGGSSEITRRWETDIKVYIEGTPTAENLSEFQKVRNEINALATNGFSIEVVSDKSQSNTTLFFGSVEQFSTLYPASAEVARVNLRAFSVWWNPSQEIYKSQIFIDNQQATATQQKSWTRGMLTGSIGLGQVSPTYSESIFYSKANTNTAFTQLDKDLIRLLYHPNMRIGLNKDEVGKVLENILLDEK